VSLHGVAEAAECVVYSGDCSTVRQPVMGINYSKSSLTTTTFSIT